LHIANFLEKLVFLDIWLILFYFKADLFLIFRHIFFYK
jgi:hypothetical protein